MDWGTTVLIDYEENFLLSDILKGIAKGGDDGHIKASNLHSITAKIYNINGISDLGKMLDVFKINNSCNFAVCYRSSNDGKLN